MSQVEPMTLAATGNHGGDIERPKARSGFPGVENAAPGTTHGLDVPPGRGGDTAGALQQIEHRSLRFENGGELSLDSGNDGFSGYGAPLLVRPGYNAEAGACHRIGKTDTGENSPVAVLSLTSRNESYGDGYGSGNIDVAVFGQGRR